MNIKIDIITIANEIDDLLFDTLNNVSNQTYQYINHVVVYRQATSEKLAKIKEFCHSKKLSTYAQNSLGIASAFNDGIKQSSGQLLLFLNSGDSLVSDSVIEKIIKSYQEDKWLWASGETISVSKNKYLKKHRQQRQTWHNSLFWYGNPVCHQSTIYSRQLVEQIGLYDESLLIGMDYEYNIKANLLSSPTLLYFPISYYDTTGVSSIKVFKQLASYRRIRDRYFQLSWFNRLKVDTYSLFKSIYRLAMIPAKLWL